MHLLHLASPSAVPPFCARCPGPAIVAFAGSLGLRLANILSGSPPLAHCLCSTTGLYLLAMVVGMLLEQRLSNALTPAKAQA